MGLRVAYAGALIHPKGFSMIKVSVFYPYTEGASFDYNYYLEHHMGLVKERLGPSLLSYSVEKGVSGNDEGGNPRYITQCNLYFESLTSLATAMGTHGNELSADVPNFTTITPVQQISEILVDTRG
jgi:uncharacterized protein (TIGR02118 family)